MGGQQYGHGHFAIQLDDDRFGQLLPRNGGGDGDLLGGAPDSSAFCRPGKWEQLRCLGFISCGPGASAE